MAQYPRQSHAQQRQQHHAQSQQHVHGQQNLPQHGQHMAPFNSNSSTAHYGALPRPSSSRMTSPNSVSSQCSSSRKSPMGSRHILGGASSSGSISQAPIAAASSSSQSETDVNHTHIVRYGKCKWFNVAKGWGFLTPNDGGQEVFVHQNVIQMPGFRSLAEQEEVEFEWKVTERGVEATRVSGCHGNDCHGSTFRPKQKKRYRRVRCYNCGEFANHIASKCELGPQPKRCHVCKQEDHLFADCPKKKTQTKENESDSEDKAVLHVAEALQQQTLQQSETATNNC